VLLSAKFDVNKSTVMRISASPFAVADASLAVA
jgi:hypothetical protein